MKIEFEFTAFENKSPVMPFHFVTRTDREYKITAIIRDSEKWVCPVSGDTVKEFIFYVIGILIGELQPDDGTKGKVIVEEKE